MAACHDGAGLFDNLSDRLQGIFKKLSGQGRISEAALNESLREIRLALLEADVHVSVAKQLLANVREKALGKDHEDVAETLNNYAVLLQRLADFTRAEAMQLRAAKILEKVHGPAHQSVGIVMTNLLFILIFYGLFTSFGLFMRFIRRDALDLKRKGDVTSYWKDAPPEKPATHYFRQY